jgi:hypothetical protein
MVSTIWGNCFQLRFNGNPREISLNLCEKSSPSWKAGDRIFWSLYFSLRKLNQVDAKNVTSEQPSDKITARLQGIVHHSLVDIQTAIALWEKSLDEQTNKDSLPENLPTVHTLIDNLIAAPLIKGGLRWDQNHLKVGVGQLNPTPVIILLYPWLTLYISARRQREAVKR